MHRKFTLSYYESDYYLHNQNHLSTDYCVREVIKARSIRAYDNCAVEGTFTETAEL